MSDFPPPQTSDLTREKAALRRELAERRAGLSAAQHALASELVAERLLGLQTLPRAAVISGYWPLALELDPRPAMARLAAAGHRLALPRMAGADQPLGFHAWQAGEALVQGPFQVLEPRAEAPTLLPDVVLLPLLGFDRQGHRLGWGKGYYDRTLRSLRRRRKALLAIGLAYALQEVERVPAGVDDEPLDLVVTEDAVHDVVASARRRRSAP